MALALSPPRLDRGPCEYSLSGRLPLRYHACFTQGPRPRLTLIEQANDDLHEDQFTVYVN